MLRQIIRIPASSKFIRQQIFKRCASTLPTETVAWRYHENGSPFEKLQKEILPLPSELKSDEVFLRFLASPINPSDINMIEGTYGLKPPMPAVGGNEGVAVVEAVGSNVSNMKVGDYVIPYTGGFGTWRNYAVGKANFFDVVPKDIPLEYLAAINVNPFSSYRLLQDYVDLQPGDVVVQNAANSVVGLGVIQIAKARGIKTINIIWDKTPDQEGLKKRLYDLGADLVVDSAFLETPAMKQLIADWPKPKLAINCVGGEIGTTTSKLLGPGGVFVTLGGMAKKRVTVTTSSLIFQDISYKGWWLTRWLAQNPQSERQKMIDYLTGLMREGKFKLFFQRQPFSNFMESLKISQTPDLGSKVILRYDEPSSWPKEQP